MRSILFFFLICISSAFTAQNIDGFWKTVNEDGVAQAIIAIYPYEGFRYGKIIASYGEDGMIDDSIYKPVKRADGLPEQPYYSGLDIIWDLVDAGYKFKGEILDPEHGDVYRSELWIDNGDLIVRGKLFIFGRSQRWYEVTPQDLPQGFSLPNLKELEPFIPQI